jgi:tRNA A-37 threonylcarbamoyl transferase component Bud32/membrane-associated phospholipid phosphatase
VADLGKFGRGPPGVGQAVSTPARPNEGRRRRRPTGTPPPLVRSIGFSGKAWLALAGCLVVATVLGLRYTPRAIDHFDTTILRQLARVRVDSITDLARWVNSAGSGWWVTVVGLMTVALLMVFRRWRHLLVYLGALAVLTVVGLILLGVAPRPRPYGVTIAGDWGGFSTLSPPVAAFTATLLGIAYTIAVPGRVRWYAKILTVALVSIFGLARLYLAVDHPSDVLLGVALAVSIPVTMFRFFTPNETFPVTYRGGNRAHLDVGGRRGAAIRQAVHDQLGLEVLEIEPIGLQGSAGSTPLRLKVADDPDTYLFAKLYAKNHVRADRWYKIWRTILYGGLEDEASFQTVRRFVEYEDYTLRLLQDLGIPTPKPYGIVEITPEREYLIAMEFFERAVEISQGKVDDRVIDNGLLLVRKLWNAGIAHRDIKPANLMVRNSDVLLIDVFFVQVRPSPWRQAVDLANMMLVLAVQTDAERVYRHAVKYFSPDEIAEAFAATRGVASPTQLRQFLKRDRRDLISEFRALAPPRRPIAIQRWSARRIAIALAMLSTTAIAVIVGSQLFLPVQDIPVGAPECGTGQTMILTAQAVPSATRLPCIATLPTGWSFESGDVHSNEARFTVGIDKIGASALEFILTPTCEVSAAVKVESDEPGTQLYERHTGSSAPYSDVRMYRFSGGCITYRFEVPADNASALVSVAEQSLHFEPRGILVRYVEKNEGLTLCGAGARCSP